MRHLSSSTSVLFDCQLVQNVFCVAKQLFHKFVPALVRTCVFERERCVLGHVWNILISNTARYTNLFSCVGNFLHDSKLYEIHSWVQTILNLGQYIFFSIYLSILEQFAMHFVFECPKDRNRNTQGGTCS